MHEFCRRLVLFACSAVALAAFSQPASSEDYPNRTVTIVLGYGAGGGADVAARFFAEKLSELSKQAFIVVNKTGANGNIAAKEVVSAKPDGYTLLWSPSSAYVSNHLLYKNTPYDPKKDLRLVTTASQYGFVLLVNKDNPANTVGELTEQLKKKGGGLYGSSATSLMASAELYKLLAGLKTEQVNYKTTPDAVRDLIGNQVDFVFVDAAFATAQIAQGRVKALGITLAQRASTASDIPTMQEAGLKGYELNGWMAMAAPRQTPDDVVAKLNRWSEQILAMPETKKFIADSGSDPFFVPLDKMPAYQDAQIEKWRCGDICRLFASKNRRTLFCERFAALGKIPTAFAQRVEFCDARPIPVGRVLHDVPQGLFIGAN
jgi:tripartite-type tricarboxylate transporter receptor subunit TctC